jgi:hypothetical protein
METAESSWPHLEQLVDLEPDGRGGQSVVMHASRSPYVRHPHMIERHG